MDEYEAQLKAVEEALLLTQDEEERNELIALRLNLQELLALTQETNDSNSNNELDDELKRFQSELSDLECSKTQQMQDENEAEQLKALRSKYTHMIGEKCSAPHEHSWGALSYHNALICGIDDEVIIDSNGILDVRLRVLFTNPTHREMLPCQYFLEGECRFDETKCRFSHGELVPGSGIKEYNEPAFHKLARNCQVLAKLKDRLWHRGHVLGVNFDEQSCRVRLDGLEHKEREQNFKFEELFPLITEQEGDDDELSSDDSSSEETTGNSSSSSTSSETESELDDVEEARRARMVELSLFTFKPTERLGAWEQYTRGIGSKLMEKMGYIHGTGLGSEGRGIVTPVSAQILPQGRSLDACMELREAANGDKDFFSVERKLKRAKRRQEAANERAYARAAERPDVFSFLNGAVLGQTQSKDAIKTNSDLQQHTTKTLNVETVRVADDIRRKQRDIAKLEQSLNRNSSDAKMQKHLRAQLQAQQQELTALQAQERSISKEQQTRKSKNKMFEF